MSTLPAYLDLCNEECGPFEIRYPQDHGGGLVATGRNFPSTYRSPKERWLLQTVEEQIAEQRRAASTKRDRWVLAS